MNSIPPSRINAVEQIETALRTLTAYGYDVSTTWREHNEWLAAFDTVPASDFDKLWATQLPEVPLSQHYKRTATHAVVGVEINHTGAVEAPVLTANICHVGRQFRLSPGQRDVLRERTGLTPTELVELVAVELFPDADVVRSFTLRNGEHIDPSRRHVLVEATITNAAEFFMEGTHQDAVRLAITESDRMVARVQRLLDRAKKRGVAHTLKGPGTVGHQLHAECDAQRIIDAPAVREKLRTILTQRGEYALADLAREPRFFPSEDSGLATVKKAKAVRTTALEYVEL